MLGQRKAVIALFPLVTTAVRAYITGVSGHNATYDYVIIGGGTAGLTVGARLAEDSSLSVAVIEAGGFYEIDNGNASVVPFSLQGSNPLVDWQFLTVPQPSLLGQIYHYIRGKCLGGSSARNFLIYQRATVGALQQWADAVDDQSYAWANILPFYQKSAAYTPARADLRLSNATAVNDTGAFLAGAGPLQVSYPNYANPVGTFYPGAFEELGLGALPNGVNTGSLIGYAYSTVTEDPTDETRSSSQTAFLSSSPSLTVYSKTMAQKIVFDSSKTARSVNVKADGVSFTLFASKEVILSAGAFQSPQLLMVSGVGPAAVLQQHNIPVVADLPGVGQNLQDNPAVFVGYTSPFVLDAAQLDAAVVPYNTKPHTGQLTSPGSEVIGWDKVSNKAFATSISAATVSDLTSSFPADWPEVEIIANANGGTVFSILATFSRGNVSISSSSVDDQPVINPGWYSDPRDHQTAIAAFRYIRALEATKSLTELQVSGETIPGPTVQTDDEILQYIRESSTCLFHASATNKMGTSSDKMAVVDAQARVFGVTNLRVVDISAFPFLVPGQPLSMVYALAEKIADSILKGK
ncbi:GMC oxidoreductase-like protein [Trichoderma pleuroticola]